MYTYLTFNIQSWLIREGVSNLDDVVTASTQVWSFVDFKANAYARMFIKGDEFNDTYQSVF